MVHTNYRNLFACNVTENGCRRHGSCRELQESTWQNSVTGTTAAVLGNTCHLCRSSTVRRTAVGPSTSLAWWAARCESAPAAAGNISVSHCTSLQPAATVVHSCDDARLTTRDHVALSFSEDRLRHPSADVTMRSDVIAELSSSYSAAAEAAR